MKNILLLAIYVIAQVPSLFFGTTERMNLSLFVTRSTRLDFFTYYYAVGINFLILAYCLHFNKGVSKKVTLFILIIMALDFVHLLLFAKQGYGMSKIGLAILIYSIYQRESINRYIKRLFNVKKGKKNGYD